jgi:hypothetical protein
MQTSYSSYSAINPDFAWSRSTHRANFWRIKPSIVMGLEDVMTKQENIADLERLEGVIEEAKLWVGVAPRPARLWVLRALNSSGDAKTLSAAAPDFFAASSAPGISSSFATRKIDSATPWAGARRVVELLELLRRDAVGVGQRRDAHSGHGFEQNLLPLAVGIACEDPDAGGVAAGLRQRRGHESGIDQIFGNGEDRKSFRRLLRGAHIRVAGGNDDVDFGFDEFGGVRRELINA